MAYQPNNSDGSPFKLSQQGKSFQFDPSSAKKTVDTVLEQYISSSELRSLLQGPLSRWMEQGNQMEADPLGEGVTINQRRLFNIAEIQSELLNIARAQEQDQYQRTRMEICAAEEARRMNEQMVADQQNQQGEETSSVSSILPPVPSGFKIGNWMWGTCVGTVGICAFYGGSAPGNVSDQVTEAANQGQKTKIEAQLSSQQAACEQAKTAAKQLGVSDEKLPDCNASAQQSAANEAAMAPKT